MAGGTILWLEPCGGCSGDMTLAALLDVGAPVDAVRAGLERLGLPGWSLDAKRGEKCGIGGIRVDVRVDASAQHERSYAEIRDLVRGAGLPAGARDRALAVFEALGRAEAKIHGTTLDHVHFHEVGAVDSIVDVVGVALALDELAPDRVHASPPPLGSGIAQSRHGPIPVPAPATLELLRGRPVRAEGTGERTTPTGAAILAALTTASTPGTFVPEAVGYGIGHRDFEDAANVLRATLGREAPPPDGELVVLEANLDDASPQLLAHALEALLAAGALDAWIAPVTMKKGRPGHLVGALAPARLRAALAEIFLRETPTLGVRHHGVGREALERRFDEVQTPYGPVPIKIGHRGAEVLNAAPEWEACREAAKRHGVPARLVRDAALAAWMTGPGRPRS